MNLRFGQSASRATCSALLRASVPAAQLTDELVDATVDDVVRLVAALPSAARPLLGVGLGVLEAGSLRPRFGSRRFSRLEPADGARYLGWWDTAPLALRRGVLLIGLGHHIDP